MFSKWYIGAQPAVNGSMKRWEQSYQNVFQVLPNNIWACSIGRTLLLWYLYFSFLNFQLIERILKPVYCSVYPRRGGSMTWPSCAWCLFTLSKPQILTGKVQDPGGGDSTLFKVQSQLRQWFGLYKYTVKKANWKIKLREFTTQEEATKNTKLNSSQWDTAKKGNDRLELQQRKFWLYLMKNAPPEHWNCCPERLANHCLGR